MNRGAPTAARIPTTKTPTTGVPAAKPAPTRGSVPRGPAVGSRSDLAQCKNCGRNFAPDRIQAHTEICLKTSRKKRKPFDATKHRVKGTELEAYVKKVGRGSQPPPVSC